jgi:hypothetical protein
MTEGQYIYKIAEKMAEQIADDRGEEILRNARREAKKVFDESNDEKEFLVNSHARIETTLSAICSFMVAIHSQLETLQKSLKD